MEQKATVEINGIIKSILQWNDFVEITLIVDDKTYKTKLPRVCCNPKKLYLNDYVKIIGNIIEYNDDEKSQYNIIFSKAQVKKLLGKKNSKMIN